MVGSARAEAYSYPRDGSVVVAGRTRGRDDERRRRWRRAGSSGSAANVSLFDGEITVDSVTGACHGRDRRPGRRRQLRRHGRRRTPGVRAASCLRAGAASGLGLPDDRPAHGRRSRPPGGIKVYDGSSIGLDVQLTRRARRPAGGQRDPDRLCRAAVVTTPPPAVAGRRAVPPATGPSSCRRHRARSSGCRRSVVPRAHRRGRTCSRSTAPVVVGQLRHLAARTSPTSTASTSSARSASRWWRPPTGTLFSVGWNQAGGNRLWLRDRQGNQFYYAHLSAFSTLAQKGAHVKAGPGDRLHGRHRQRQGMPTHLHFEVHPVSMLFLGYDGAVDPGAYLASWRHIANLSFPVATGWAPNVPGTIKAPEPGAVLIGSHGHLHRDGLDPAVAVRAWLASSSTRLPVDVPAPPARCCDGSTGRTSRVRCPSPPDEIRSRMKCRVSAPVTGLKRIPSAIPRRAGSRRDRRPLAAALEALAGAAEVLDRLAELVADVVVGRDPARDHDRLAPVADRARRTAHAPSPKARSTSWRSFSSFIARRRTAGPSRRRLRVCLALRHELPLLSAAVPGRPLRVWPVAAMALLAVAHPCRLRGVGGAKCRSVHGQGFQFEAPVSAGSCPQGRPRRRRARRGRPVEVHRSSSRSRIAWRSSEAASRELDGVVSRLAGQLSGRVVTRRTVRIAGRKSPLLPVEYGPGKIAGDRLRPRRPDRVRAPLPPKPRRLGRHAVRLLPARPSAYLRRPSSALGMPCPTVDESPVSRP